MTTHTAALSFSSPRPSRDGEDLPGCRAAVLFLVHQIAAPTFEKVSALLYLADRTHLSRYGALMFGGAYEAMRDGPVPTVLINLAMAGPIDVREAPDLDELSAGVLDVLEEVIARHGDETPQEASAHTRGEAWQSCPPGQAITALRIAKTLPNAAAVVDYLEVPHP